MLWGEVLMKYYVNLRSCNIITNQITKEQVLILKSAIRVYLRSLIFDIRQITDTYIILYVFIQIASIVINYELDHNRIA